MKHLHLRTNGVRLHAVRVGPDDATPILLLHGFPESWRAWDEVLPRLASAGVAALALDMRGYGESDRPTGVAAYAMGELLADILGVLDQLDGPVHLVAHDWGGALAWRLAMTHPDRLCRLTILSSPHPVVMARALNTGWQQKLDSWYFLAFQVPWLPERLGSVGHAAFMAWAVRRAAQPDAFSDETMAALRDGWSDPARLGAQIDWYRAMVRHPVRLPKDRVVRVPTRILWGEGDTFLRSQMADESLAFCPVGEVRRFSDCGHFFAHERPDDVVAAILEA